MEVNVKPMDDPSINNSIAQDAPPPAVAPEPAAIKYEPTEEAEKEEPLIEKAVKRRTWKKPKDKPKRPLSSYNLFFQHTRTRLVEGHTVPATPDEIVRSVEWIVTKCREKRPHRKTHGRISFGDLARTIAEKWRTVDTQTKSIFDQYAEVDMIRYRKEVQIWKDKKDRERAAESLQWNRTSLVQSMNTSFSSVDSSKTGASWQPRNPSSLQQEAMNSSYSTLDSCESEFSLEPMPINNTIQMQMHMQMQQMQMQQMQIQQQQLYQHQQQKQQHQHIPQVMYQQQQQVTPLVNFIPNVNQGSMTSFPAVGGGSYGNASFNIMAPGGGGNYGNNASNTSLMAPNDTHQLGVSSSQISDYTASNNMSGHTSGNFSSSFASGTSWGA